MNLFTFERDSNINNRVTIDSLTAKSIGLEEGKKVELCYGKRKISINISIDPLSEPGRIKICNHSAKNLLLDTKVKYEVAYRNNQLIIGPVIGLLLGKTNVRLKENLHQYLNYTLLYNQINGVLFVFCEEDIDRHKEQITGYIYDPDTQDQWRRVILPLPGAIFRRVELSSKTMQFLCEKMGRGFFNAKYFDKWTFWQWLSPIKEVRQFLPQTSNNLTIEVVDDYLSRYGGAYIKPRGGSRGKGIHFIRKNGLQYDVIKNYEDKIRYMSNSEMINFLGGNSHYLIQQPILLKSYEQRKVDYRVIMQKNENGFWQCTGIIARFGKANAMTSNFKAKGYAKEGIEALMIQFGYDQLKAFQKYQEIVDICIKMSKIVDQIGGGYADLGIDVGLDEEGKVWVIEMNKRPDHDFPLIIKDKKMYYSVKTNPIMFAKHVAMTESNK